MVKLNVLLSFWMFFYHFECSFIFLNVLLYLFVCPFIFLNVLLSFWMSFYLFECPFISFWMSTYCFWMSCYISNFLLSPFLISPWCSAHQCFRRSITFSNNRLESLLTTTESCALPFLASKVMLSTLSTLIKLKVMISTLIEIVRVFKKRHFAVAYSHWIVLYQEKQTASWWYFKDKCSHFLIYDFSPNFLKCSLEEKPNVCWKCFSRVAFSGEPAETWYVLTTRALS